MTEKVRRFFFVDVVRSSPSSDMVHTVLKKRVGSRRCRGCGTRGPGCIFELFFEAEIVHICRDHLTFLPRGFVNTFEPCGYEGVAHSLK